MARIKAVAAKEMAAKEVAKKAQEVEAAPALVCPRAAEKARAEAEAAAKNDASAKGKGHRSPLNEVSVMSELDKKRQGLLDADA